MVHVLDYALTIFGYALASAIVAASVVRGYLRRYFYLNLYVVALCAFDALRYAFLRAYGFRSPQYFYAYFLTDAISVILAYLLILGFFDILFRNSPLRAQVRVALFLFFALVAGTSYIFISHSVSHFYSRLVVEFQQNMYFAALVLTVLLLVSLAHLRVRDRQLGLLITGLGIFAPAPAGGYALQNLLPRDLFEALSELTRRVPALATLAMLSLWCYALVQVPTEAGTPAQAPALEPAKAAAGAKS